MRTSWWRVGAMVLLVAGAAYGCASAPDAEKKAAEDAVKAASAAGAEQFAAQDYKEAMDTLKDAEGQLQAKKYDEAKAAYVKAKQMADKATAAVPAGKAALKQEVETQLAEVEKRWTELEGKVNAAAKRLKAEQQQAWEAEGKDAKEALEAAKAAAADDPAAAKGKLAALVGAIDKWEAEVAALAAPALKTPKKS